MVRDFRKHKLFFLVTVGLLFLSFAFDGFGAVDTSSFVLNFKDSEALVANEVTCEGKYYAGQMLEKKNPETSITQRSCAPNELKPYSSQFGLQGRLYMIGYRIADATLHVSARAYIAFSQLLTALLSAVCFAVLALWVRCKLGLFAANSLTAFVAISPMLVGFGRNLYWALPLLILPFIYVLWAYDTALDRKRSIIFWSVVGLLLYLRYLCGYEYLTTITIMVAAGIAYHLYVAKAVVTTYLKHGLIVLVVSVAAFAAALGTHIFALQTYTHSTAQAVQIVKSRALARTTGSGDYLAYPLTGLKTNLPDYYAVSNSYVNLEGRSEHPTELWATAASFMNYAMLPVFNLPIALHQPFATYIQSLSAFVIALIVLYRQRRKWVTPDKLRQIEALFVGAAVGFMGFLSWWVLAHSHSLVHAHINGILLYLPFALFGYLILGLFVQSMLTSLKRYKSK